MMIKVGRQSDKLETEIRYLTIRSLILLTFVALVFLIAATAREKSTLIWLILSSVPVAVVLAISCSWVSTRSRRMFILKAITLTLLLEGMVICIAAVFQVKLAADADFFGVVYAPFALVPAVAGTLTLIATIYMINVNEAADE